MQHVVRKNGACVEALEAQRGLRQTNAISPKLVIDDGWGIRMGGDVPKEITPIA